MVYRSLMDIVVFVNILVVNVWKIDDYIYNFVDVLVCLFCYNMDIRDRVI